jgi:hypothetical protein
MIRMELVGDPNNFEDKFVRVEVDDEVSVYRQTEFVLDVEGNKKSIQLRQIPFYQVED